MDDFPELRDGDQLEPWHYNVLARDATRWRNATGIAPITVSFAGEDDLVISLDDTPPFFIQLTATYASGYAWKEVLIGPGRTLVDSGITGSPSAGRPAFELQSGDTTLAVDGTVYEARVSPASNQILFDGLN